MTLQPVEGIAKVVVENIPRREHFDWEAARKKQCGCNLQVSGLVFVAAIGPGHMNLLCSRPGITVSVYSSCHP